MENQEVLTERLRLKISPSMSRQIDDFGISVGLNRSEVTRSALSFFLKTFENVDTEQIKAIIS